ncbi:MAG: SIS domain-containing protein [bacterium]|nr:SIS domain-containing protein [bacterium]
MSAQAFKSGFAESGISRASMLARGRQVLRSEMSALGTLLHHLDDRFIDAAEQLVQCRGRVIVTGIGKAGIIGQKFSASLSSTGTASHFLHPAEAVHGDLGCVRPGDMVVLLSYSGETEEILRLLPLLERMADGSAAPEPADREPLAGVHGKALVTLAITRDQACSLGRGVDYVVPLGSHKEACGLGLAPTCTTTLMLALCDALAIVASEARGFTRKQFADFHPGGSLGRKLTPVTEVMRPLAECRVASQELTVREVFVHISRPGRRTGAIMLTDDCGRLSGIFTDSDLARLLERQQDDQLDRPVRDVMSRHFFTVDAGAKMDRVLGILKERKISELPVVGSSGQPLGIVDITDVVDLAAERRAAEEVSEVPQVSNEAGLPRILSLIKYQKEAG